MSHALVIYENVPGNPSIQTGNNPGSFQVTGRVMLSDGNAVGWSATVPANAPPEDWNQAIIDAALDAVEQSEYEIGETDVRTVLGLVTAPPAAPSVPEALSDPGWDTAFQVSAGRACDISITVDVACSLTALGSESGRVALMIGPSSSLLGLLAGEVGCSRSIGVGISVNDVASARGALNAHLPAGWWAKLVRTTTGTPAYSFIGATKTLR